jgi:hypothetical protein
MLNVVINECFGGFGLSKEAILRYSEIKGLNLIVVSDDGIIKGRFWDYYYTNGIVEDSNYFDVDDIPRDDPALIQVIKELGETANGDFAELKIVEVPDGVDWSIDKYDGMECVCKSHDLGD